MMESSAESRAKMEGEGALGFSSREAIAQMGDLCGEAGSEVSWGGERLKGGFSGSVIEVRRCEPWCEAPVATAVYLRPH